MNDRDIAFAKQAGFNDADWDYRKGIATLIDLIRADEREAILELADSLGWVNVDAIRARENNV